jgi:hypothetical protein
MADGIAGPVTAAAPPVAEIAGPVTAAAPPVAEIAGPVTAAAPPVAEIIGPATAAALQAVEIIAPATAAALQAVENTGPVTVAVFSAVEITGLTTATVPPDGEIIGRAGTVPPQAFGGRATGPPALAGFPELTGGMRECGTADRKCTAALASGVGEEGTSPASKGLSREILLFFLPKRRNARVSKAGLQNFELSLELGCHCLFSAGTEPPPHITYKADKF